MLALVYFIILGVIAVGAALCVLLSRHPLYGALSLIVSMVSLAGIYGLVGSPFLGVVQVMVYAGAIMMLVTFVIMVLNGAKDKRTPMFDGVSFFIIPSVVVLAAMVGFALMRAPLAFDSAKRCSTWLLRAPVISSCSRWLACCCFRQWWRPYSLPRDILVL